MNCSVDGTEQMRIDSAGRLMLGTTTEGHPNADDLTIAGSGHAGITIRSGTTSTGGIFFSDATTGSGEYDGYIEYNQNTREYNFGSAATDAMRIDASQNLKFNSGYGSVATAYGVRAWINFAGDGSSIGSGRGSGNMDAVTDNGTGRYTMNFTNDMPDTNYSAYGSCAGDSSSTGDESKITFAHTSRAVGSIAVRVVDPVDDPLTVSIAIIR